MNEKPRPRPARANPRQVTWLEPDQVRLVLEQLTPTDRQLALITLYTGARPRELFQVRRDDIDFQGRLVSLPTPIGKRQVPYRRELGQVLEQLDGQPGGWLLPGGPDRHTAAKEFRSRVQAALNIAGFRKHRVFDLRHTCAMWLREAADVAGVVLRHRLRGVDPARLSDVLHQVPWVGGAL